MPTDIMQSQGAVKPAASPSQFPFLDLKAQYATIRDEVQKSVLGALDAQQFILGPDVAALESEIAAYVGCPYAIGCASGSDALILALMALDVRAGDEVIAPPFTFFATAGAIARLGARTVFVDIDPKTYNLDPQLLEAAITPRTKAIIPVHLFGLAADMAQIMKIAQAHDLPVIEDAAQAIGAQYQGKSVGNIGTVGCFSFFPSKNLGGGGDGGMITTNSAKLNDRLRMLRVHGSRKKYTHDELGMNSRLDTLQAAILRVKLRHLDNWTAGRQRNATLYRELFAEHGLEQQVQAHPVPADHVHVYNQFTVRVRERDALKSHLQKQGLPTEVYYPHPLHLQAALADLGYKSGAFPVTETACSEVLSLPIYSELSTTQIQTVVGAIAEFYEQQGQLSATV
jgi:dTDP-4-amino-4,6-dideoxygalactose transaminase